MYPLAVTVTSYSNVFAQGVSALGTVTFLRFEQVAVLTQARNDCAFQLALGGAPIGLIVGLVFGGLALVALVVVLVVCIVRRKRAQYSSI